ncbi:hypothetical protein JCM19297_1367 [Nonlabens ulvanivorans]|nr:T9SS type A sorting domain-containing protein [Nonlabens ulvanivorans]GAK89539.1 hypothetical protein JCM19297_1367 [Nonlabens ulvanivorans]
MLTERDFIVNKSVIDGDINSDDMGTIDVNNTTRSDNTYRLFQVYNDGVVFDGLVFKNGNAFGSSNNGSIERLGSAIYASHEFQVLNCEFIDNLSVSGGVIQMQQQLSGAVHNIAVTNSIFQNNRCADGIITSSNGSNTSLSLNIENCLLTDNIFNVGIISANAARSGVNLNVNIVNTTIANNETTSGGLTNTQVVRNRIGTNSSSTFIIENSIIWNNFTSSTAGNPLLRLTGLSGGDTNGGGSLGILNIGNSISQSTIGSTNTNNVLFNDPLFNSTSDYSLQSSSTAIDAGDNQFVNTMIDLAGNTRIANTTVDMGAYEFGSTASINEVEQLSISLYPNPAIDMITVAVENNAFAKAEIYNLQGQRVAISKETTIQVSELRTGMYILRITTDNGSIGTQQFIKK